MPAKAMTDELARQIVTELQSPKSVQVLIALGDLRRFPPTGVSEANRAAVEKQVIPALRRERADERRAAVLALEQWGSSSSIEALNKVAASDVDLQRDVERVSRPRSGLACLAET